MNARGGRRQIGGYFEPKVVRSLRRLAADRDATHQVLLAEALNDLFEKYGYERVADETQAPRGGAALKARLSKVTEEPSA
ncbi:ribbon-helix-helix domain-containing protein [Aminobacter sp. Piv2-1]|uniref:ribbon-helix-helix domain-containing protein n=1 Tax=Aminobacter sp. Piv2-1 TaxID=3031122 RepID=UPI0030EBB44D